MKIFNTAYGNMDMSGEEHLTSYASKDAAEASVANAIKDIFEEDGDLREEGYQVRNRKDDDGSTVIAIWMPLADEHVEIEWWRITETELEFNV